MGDVRKNSPRRSGEVQSGTGFEKTLQIMQKKVDGVLQVEL